MVWFPILERLSADVQKRSQFHLITNEYCATSLHGEIIRQSIKFFTKSNYSMKNTTLKQQVMCTLQYFAKRTLWYQIKDFGSTLKLPVRVTVHLLIVSVRANPFDGLNF
jgi:hypothetical protein